jgi:hypothetical protein
VRNGNVNKSVSIKGNKMSDTEQTMLYIFLLLIVACVAYYKIKQAEEKIDQLFKDLDKRK